MLLRLSLVALILAIPFSAMAEDSPPKPAAPMPSAAPDPAAAMMEFIAKRDREDPGIGKEMKEFMAASYPVDRPARAKAAPTQSRFEVHLLQTKQTIEGIGFEIQSDSIASGNAALPEHEISVPHDLIPAERDRLYQEMLKGFRYCRLAGGLYWRGLDAEGKTLQPRWPGQLAEIKEMITAAGIEGVSLEYWSPPPFWKANRQYTREGDSENKLRCFGRDFANDPEYHGDIDRFLRDMAEARVADLKTLRAAGIPVVFWGLQAEPSTDASFSSCPFTPEQYARTFKAVAPAVRAYDPKIRIIADTGLSLDFRYARPVLKDPAFAQYIDALVVHLIGWDSKHLHFPVEPSGKPRFNNEFEYLAGPATPARTLNTVQHIMNWFQLGDAPTWFWIHALKPVGNAEASGYSLGFWRPSTDNPNARSPSGLQVGHWGWNKYNWYAVGSFVKHMPWNCVSVAVTELDGADDDLRIMTFKRPNGKLTVVLSNRSFVPHRFTVTTGLSGKTFKGYRYTPESAGIDCRGVEVGELSEAALSIEVPDMAWEFWEEQ